MESEVISAAYRNSKLNLFTHISIHGKAAKVNKFCVKVFGTASKAHHNPHGSGRIAVP